MICLKCSAEFDDIMMKQERKPGINPYESALGMKDGFTEPRPCCPECREYLDEEETVNA